MTTNPESILDSVKKVLGFDSEYTAFDIDVLMSINSAFGSLQQFGVGSDDGFFISDNTTLWAQYISHFALLNMVKQYIFFNVRLAFDPPGTSFAIDAIKDQIQQLGWRINIEAERLNPPSDPFGKEEPDDMFFKVEVVNVDYASVIDLDSSVGNTFYSTLTGDCTINAPVNGTDGGHLTLELISNGYSVTWGSGWNFGSAGEPSLSPSGTDIISAMYKASVAQWRAGFTSGF